MMEPEIKIGKSFVVPLEVTENNVQLHMQWISPGRFVYGDISPQLREKHGFDPPFEIMFSKGYWIGTYLVTQAQWNAVMNNQSSFNYLEANHPIDNISWLDAIEFCSRLNQKISNLPENYKFSLPTSAQWEYACRAGTTTLYYSGDTVDDLSKVAWHRDNSHLQIHPVGLKSANNWGLYDMHGNVIEMCYDSPTDDIPVKTVNDWIIDNPSDPIRELRGADYIAIPTSDLFFCVTKYWWSWDEARSGVGFRLCLRSS